MKTLLIAALLGTVASGGVTMAHAGPIAAVGQDGAAPAPGAMRGRGGGMARLDTDGDGKVSRAEYDAQSARRFARMDINGDGVVDRAEMAALIGRGRMAGRIDADGTGTLTRAQYDAQAGQRFARMDANEDGLIDAAELRSAAVGRRGSTPPAPAPTGA